MRKDYIEPQSVVVEIATTQAFAQSQLPAIRPWDEMGEVNDDLAF